MRLVEVIIPLPMPRLDLRGDFFLGCASPRVTVAFLGGWLSFLSTFLLAEPLETALGVDEDAPSFPLALLYSSFLWVTAALTLCLATSISAKDNRRALEKQMIRIKLTGMVENLLTTARVFVQSASFRRWFRAPTVRMKSVKSD